LRNPTAEGRACVRYGVGETPIGFVCVATTERGICSLCLLDSDESAPALRRLRVELPGATLVPDPEMAGALVPRIIDFLHDGRISKSLTPDLRGTPFQMRVWQALTEIPRGTTTAYGMLARRLGLPTGAARAVGSACGANPVSLLVPCHRVIRAGGLGLGGYYWGLEKKRALLALEGVAAGEFDRASRATRHRVVGG